MTNELLIVGKYVLAEIVALVFYTLSGMAKASKTATFDKEKLKDGIVKNLYILGCYVCIVIIGVLLPSEEFTITGYENLGSFTAFGILLYLCKVDLWFLFGMGVVNLFIARGLVEFIKSKIDKDNSEETTTETTIIENVITKNVDELDEDGGLA